MTREDAIARLVKHEMVVTEHNISCMQFYNSLEVTGGHALLDTVCFEGSEAQKWAKEMDEMVGV